MRANLGGHWRAWLSSDTGSGRSLQNCAGLAWDATQGRAIAVLDTTGGTALIAIDLSTGDRTSITDPATEFGMPPKCNRSVLLGPSSTGNTMRARDAIAAFERTSEERD